MDSPEATPAGSSRNSSPDVLTPRRKVQALLAGLSDSEEDVPITFKGVNGPTQQSDTADEADDSSDDATRPRGRVAVRLAQDVDLGRDDLAQQASRRDNDAQDRKKYDEEDMAQLKRKFLLRRGPSSTTQISSDEDAYDTRTTTVSSPLSVKSAGPGGSKRRIESGLDPSHVSSAATTDKTRFQVLVEKQRKLRLEREEAERVRLETQRARLSELTTTAHAPRGSSPADGSDEDSDASVVRLAKKLTKDARPTRKASRKALEEMNRETQRMNRNMQLAHEARTKKKFSKESLLSRFAMSEGNDQNTGSSKAMSSDSETMRLASTPPTSPLRTPNSKSNTELQTVSNVCEVVRFFDAELDDIPSLEQMLATRRAKQGKDKIAPTQRGAQPRVLRLSLAKLDSGSDSDLEIVAAAGQKRRYAVFENLPKKKAREQPSHLALRSLANMRSEKSSMSGTSASEMQAALKKAARDQAKEERQAKIEKLKARGIIVQTAEENERDQQEVEDLLEKARQEAAEIQKREKERAKQDGTFEKDMLDDSDSDDEDDDFEEGMDVDGAESGSEDELDRKSDVQGSERMLDDTAQESDDGSALSVDTDIRRESKQSGDDELEIRTPQPVRQTRRTRVVEDDDDDDNEPETANEPTVPILMTAITTETLQIPHRSARKIIPGLQDSGSLPLNLTQAFAATMAESQTQQDSIDMLGDLPAPTLDLITKTSRSDSLDLIAESPISSQTQHLNVNLEMFQIRQQPDSPSLTRVLTATQAPFELTQDGGFSYSPFSGNRFADTPNRTSWPGGDTAVEAAGQSPVLQRKRRLQRGHQPGDEGTPKTAFSIMQNAAAMKKLDVFDKKRSDAKQAFDEAAEESDDEYAGLGGASDEDSDDEANEQDKAMVDDDIQIDAGDESRLAQLHADRERASDEAAVSKLLKDITTGGLRRKRGVGGEFDLSDEEDDAARRREAKRREFAKMRRELLKDEAVGKIAEDEKKQAFLRSIEDREIVDDESLDFDRPETQEAESQAQPELQGEYRSVAAAADSDSQDILQPASESKINRSVNIRRTKLSSVDKPTTLAEIRESVSFLIEEPESQAATIDLGLSDSESEPELYVDLDRHFRSAEADERMAEDDEDDLGGFIVDDVDRPERTGDEQQSGGFKIPPRPKYSERRTRNASHGQVIDRLNLLRQSSSSCSATAGTGPHSSTNKLAFSLPRQSSSTSVSAFGPSSLLRRATTNSGLGSMSTSLLDGNKNSSGRDNNTARKERGSTADEKEFVRKGNARSLRNAVNYQGGNSNPGAKVKNGSENARATLSQEQMRLRLNAGSSAAKGRGNATGFLGGLFRGDSWE